MSRGTRRDARQLGFFDGAAPKGPHEEGLPRLAPTDGADSARSDTLWHELGPDAIRLPGFALADTAALEHAIKQVTAAAAPRRMSTPGGGMMASLMSNCGALGWVSDERGYRYADVDPKTGGPWPAMPEVVRSLACRAAAHALSVVYAPDSCVLNQYVTGAGMGLHRDDNEASHEHPIVSISLGCTARFFWGGRRKSDPIVEVPLRHGDVVVWGGQSRLVHHGVAPLAAARHPTLGSARWNLTVRRARSDRG